MRRRGQKGVFWGGGGDQREGCVVVGGDGIGVAVACGGGELDGVAVVVVDVFL